ncbi:hypothetical protein DSO57_1017642 [Entomophthora muscae]|uniref:Uncharacterized protein n=1 Tax=Entomophthora muscae TaxID=34485 RepID=A0ACC2RVR1_9FUNG|nr:hypothetical protein DSO57_1017642 [Entomophthora muscae]
MAFQIPKDAEDYRQVEPSPMITQPVHYFSPYHMNIDCESNNLINNDPKSNSRKRSLTEYDLTAGFKKMKLAFQNDTQFSTDIANIDMMEEACEVQEIQEPRLYVDDAYLDIANKIPSLILRPTPSEELEYLNNRQLVLYKPFIWRRLFYKLFKRCGSENDEDPMDCEDSFSAAPQTLADESMEPCEEDIYCYGEPMETD